MSDYVGSRKELVRFASELKEVLEKYGPFEVLDVDEAKEVPKDLIWTGLWLDHQILTNGFFDEPDTYIYMRAKHPCSQEPRSMRVVDVAWYDCPYCEGNENNPQGCKSCSGEGCYSVDLDEILQDSSVDLTSEDILWSRRSSG